MEDMAPIKRTPLAAPLATAHRAPVVLHLLHFFHAYAAAS